MSKKTAAYRKTTVIDLAIFCINKVGDVLIKVLENIFGVCFFVFIVLSFTYRDINIINALSSVFAMFLGQDKLVIVLVCFIIFLLITNMYSIKKINKLELLIGDLEKSRRR